jgi:uncharacterized protein YjbI with pentapeptide repeats
MKADIVRSPRLPTQLEHSTDLRQLLMSDRTINAIEYVSQDITNFSARSAIINESILDRLSAAEANLERLSLTQVSITRGELTATNCEASTWQTVKLKDTRCSGLKLQTGTLKDVTFANCKLDLANFRYTKLERVRFIDCILSESDFYMATLKDVFFENCSLISTEFSSAKCKNVDLRGSDVSTIRGISGLKGAIIDSMQLIAIAPLLAQEAGLSVKD